MKKYLQRVGSSLMLPVAVLPAAAILMGIGYWIDPTFLKIKNAFVGIISGIVASIMYNRYSHVKLPDAFAFFSGKRLVPIMTAVSMLVVSGVLFFIWPLIYTALITFGKTISDLGP